MRHGNADVLIRGGQTTQHWFRMGAQVFKTALIFSLLFVAVAWCFQAYNYYEVEKLHLMIPRFQAEFFVESRGTPETQIRYKHPEMGWIAQTAAEVYRNQFIKEVYEEYNAKAADFFYIALIPGGLAGLIAFIFFWISGRDMEGDYHVRGTFLVTAKELKKWSKAKWKEYEREMGKEVKSAPRYTINGIQFPPNTVEAQTVISGTVGTGKTNALRELVSTIRELDGKAIIYDRMGTFVENYYDPEKDVIINPFDKRSHAWSPFYEAEDDVYFTQLAEVFIPDRPNVADQFWTQSARIVFEQAAKQIFSSGEFSNKRLTDAILQFSAAELSDLVSETAATHFFNKDISKTAGSIRANLVTELRFLEFLRDDGEPFSIRQWIKNDDRKGFVFLTGDAEHAAATRNIISSIIETAANALMTCDQVNDPKVWFIMDEVPTLNRLPFLPTSLAEIRQFGGAFVLGYQVYSQMEALYGEKDAQTITGNLNNRIVFNTPDADTADVFSKSLGSEDVEERRESMTVGANETRDGVGFMSQRTERRIVTPSQIQNLPQFQAYIAFGYDSPTAFVKFKPYPSEKIAKKFVRYTGNGFAENEMQLLGARTDGEDGREPMEAAKENFKEKPTFEDEFQRYKDCLVEDGLAFFVEPENEDRLRDHFAKQRAKKVPIKEIGPPPLSGHMMGRNDEPGMKRNTTWQQQATWDAGATHTNNERSEPEDDGPSEEKSAEKPAKVDHKSTATNRTRRSQGSMLDLDKQVVNVRGEPAQ